MSETTWRVAAMVATDLPAVFHVECQSPSPWSHQQLAEELTWPKGVQLTCCSEDENRRLAGFLLARLQDDEAEILKIATAQAYKRRGVASQLIQDFIALAGSQGVQRCHLELRAQNHAALSLYEKYAFEVTGRRPNYYTAPIDDALCMTLTLPSRVIACPPPNVNRRPQP